MNNVNTKVIHYFYQIVYTKYYFCIKSVYTFSIQK